LAKRAGVTQAMVARLEDPNHNPTLETLDRVVRALGCELIVDVKTPPSDSSLGVRRSARFGNSRGFVGNSGRPDDDSTVAWPAAPRCLRGR
jgi:transcriptional regulator with XRE-family HTH domain